MPDNLARTGLVVIGRNEGERLKRCLRSVPQEVPAVYVDSASSDGSVEFARSIGVDVVELNMVKSFTAARARNEGFNRLVKIAPSLEFVQFVDGDCELEEGWLATSEAFLRKEYSYGVACGRRKERHPEASFYNRMCDDEWNTPVGEALSCGGDAMYRIASLASVGGFDPTMVAGEEPELCQRLRSAGWKIRRLSVPMTIHDAAMHETRQWWMRTIRSGFGYAQVFHKSYKSEGKPIYLRQVLSALFWTFGISGVAIGFIAIAGPLGISAAPLAWSLQLMRLTARKGWLMGSHLLLGKLAETIGVTRYVLAVIRRRGQGAILYK